MFETANKTEKVSDRIIDQIRDAVLSGRLKPGDRVASEKELMVQFAVSKATMREALRVLEALGLVEIRKGTQGGVFIAEVGMKTTIHSMMNFLHFKPVSVRDITMMRFMLEPSVAFLAAQRLGAEDARRLEGMIESGEEDGSDELTGDIGFHRYLARLTENPILILIMDFIDNMLRDLKGQLALGPEFHGQVKRFHREVLAYLQKGDCQGACRAITEDLLWVGDHLAERTGTPRFDPAVMPAVMGHAQRAGELQGQDGLDLNQALLQGGMVLRSLGSGDLYMVVPRDKPGL
jgi:GntR family transcriptional regulator, transcriptional repressor for pyruvate dehydrogenase complex